MNNPQPGEIRLFLDILKAHREEILSDPHFLIEQTFEEINQEWQPGTLDKIKRSRPREWKRMVAMEAMINEESLTGDIEGLGKVLKEYRDVMLGMVKVLSLKGGQTSLFNTPERGDMADGEREMEE